ALFGSGHRIPTLAQYIPELFFFEDIGNRLACSSSGGLPLVRYDLKDRGNVQSFAEMLAVAEKNGVDLRKEAAAPGIAEKIWHLPFVSVFERDDLTVSIYSVNIYPESIRKALQKRALEDDITGKFAMLVDYNKEQNQFLEINIELKQG